MTVRDRLLAARDTKNAAFQAKLTPGVAKEKFLGVRVPELRKIEKALRGTTEAEEFLRTLPHKYYDENILHGIFISNMKGYDEVLAALEKFLPYVDNWAVCDTLRPAVFKKRKDGLIEKVKAWIASEEVYTCRFGMGILMAYFLDEDFLPEYLELPATVESEEYYINMMAAWYYATALAKQWEATVPYIGQGRLSPWVHNKTIQKARESYRITDEQKEYLKTLKRQAK